MPEPLWERILVAATGPIVAALLGTVLVAIYLQRRSAREAESRDEATARRQFEFRQALVDAMTRAVVPLEVVCQADSARERRSHQSEDGPTLQREDVPTRSGEISGDLDATGPVQMLRDLDEAYRTFRIEASALRRRLRAHYASEELHGAWHAVEDLLGAYYHLLRRLDDLEKVLPYYAGKDHSGLNVEQLRQQARDPKLIHDTTDTALNLATNLVVTSELKTIDMSKVTQKRR
jgi:hypothetical protein